jgi:hypothetical protein
MPSYSGVWTLTAQYQAIGGQNWPMGPGAPTSVSATAGDTQATITFTAPTFTGVPPGITGYLATSSPGGITATGASSPLTVTGLTNGTAYTFGVQATNGVQYGPAGTSGSVTPSKLQRGLFGGGSSPSTSNVIDYINIASTGNALDFGDLTLARFGLASCSSSTRGLWAGGEEASRTNVIDYVTISSLGNAADFGDLSVIDSYSTTAYLAACSDETRGIIGGGENAGNGSGWNVIQYITIASTGNTTNFGDLTLARRELSSCSSTTRGVWGGGRSSGSTYLDTIDFVTITSTGNASNFGNLTVARTNLAACSSSTRGVFGGGNAASNTNTLDYITIASTGNAVDFGDLTAVCNGVAATSGTTRGVFALGGGDSGRLAGIDFVTIASTGNATSFGNLTQARNLLAACSSAHGGL